MSGTVGEAWESLPSAALRQLSRGVKVMKAAEGDVGIILDTSKVCLSLVPYSSPPLLPVSFNVNCFTLLSLKVLTYKTKRQSV